jgi:hypothetical protein
MDTTVVSPAVRLSEDFLLALLFRGFLVAGFSGFSGGFFS